MPENDFQASIGFVADASSIQRIQSIIASSVDKGTQQGLKKGLIQGINANAFTQPLGRITGKANEFEKSMAAANARVIAFGASTAPIFAMASAFHKLVDSTVEVEKMMVGINAIFQLSQSSLNKFTTQLFETANKSGQSFQMASEAANEFARQGLSVEETLERTSAALILNKISGLNMAEAVSSVTSVLNGFSKEALSATEIIQRMTAVDTQFAVSAADLSEALKRVGASANDANVSMNQTLALITATRQITGREGSVIGNSFKTMFTRLQRPEVLDDLEKAGIQVRDLNGKTLPLIEVLKSLASTYQGLAQSQKSFVSEAVGGVYQINILKGVMRDLGSGMSIYGRAVEVADNSTSAVTKRMATLNSTLSAGLVRTMNDLSLAASEVGQNLFGNSMRSGISIFDSAFRGVASGMDKDNKDPIAQVSQGAVKGLGNFLTGPGLQMGLNLIIKLLAELEKFARASGKDILGLDKTMKEKEALENRFFQILSKEPAVMDAIINKQKTLNSLIEETVGISVSENKSSDLRKQVAGVVASQLVGKGLYHGTNLSAGGFVPNLNSVQSEMSMAAQGGYTAGRVISTQIQNGNHRLNAVANTNETKSSFFSDGKQYQFINPPYGSMAGKSHERDAIAKTGINPYALAQMPLAAEGYAPNLRDLLKNRQFKSFVYQKGNGDTGTYHLGQWGVKKDNLVGAQAPSGHKSWGQFDESTNTIALWVKKEGEKEAKFRRFSLDKFKQLHTKGGVFNFAGGYAPLMDALSRENTATGGNAVVSHDSRLVTSENPLGLAAIDKRTQRSANHAISQHLAMGQSLNQVQKAHSAKGFVPNLALDSGFNASLMLTIFGAAMKETHAAENIEKLVGTFPMLFDVTQKEIIAKRKLVKEFDEMGKNLLTTGKTQSFYGQSFNSMGEVGASKLNETIDAFRQDIKENSDKQETIKESSYKTGFKVANISSFGGAMVSQAAGTYGTPSLGAATDDFSTSLTSAGQALIAFPNKIGKALGAGFFINGITNFVDTLTKGAENSKAAVDIQLTQIKNVTETLQSLAQTSNNLSNLYLDAGTSIETISRESKKFSDTLGTLSQMKGGQALVRKILSSPDADARQAAIQNSIAQKGQESETIASLQNLKDLLLPKRFLGMNHLPGFQKDEGFTYNNYFDKDTVKQQLVENASIPVSNMSKDFQEALLKNIDSLEDFNKTLNTFSGGNADSVREYLGQVKGVAGNVGYGQVIDQMRAILIQKNIFDKNPEIQKLVTSSRSQTENSQLNVDSAIKNQQYLKRLFLNQGGLMSNNLLDVRESANRGQYYAASNKLSGYDNESSLFSQTHGDRTIAQREYGISTQRNALETKNALNSLNLDTNKQLIGELSQDFDKVLKATDLKENITGEKNLGVSENKALLVSAINNGLTNTLKGNSSDIIGKFSKNGQFDFQAFSKAAAQAGSNNPLTQSRVEKYLNSQQSVDILKMLNSSSNKQAEILQEFKSKSVEEAQKLNAAIAEADFKKFNNYLGGIQTLLDRNNARTLMREMTRGMALMNSQSPEARAQGAGMVLKSMQSQGFEMSENNSLVKKAHQVIVDSGMQTYQKYANRIEGFSDRRFGAGSAESNGLRQGYNQDLRKVLEAQYQGAFKPETGADNSGAFINSVQYLQPFNDGLKAATDALIAFPDSLKVTNEALQMATGNIDAARNENKALIQDIDNTLDNAFKQLFDKYGGAAKGVEPKQQNNAIGLMQSAVAPIGALVAQAITVALINKGAAGIGGFLQKNISILNKSKGLASNIEAGEAGVVSETISGARGGRGLGGGMGGGGGGGIVANGVSDDFAKASSSWNKLLGNEIGPKMPAMTKTKSIYDSVLGKLGNLKSQESKILKKLIDLKEESNKFLDETAKKYAQKLKIGGTTGNSAIDSSFSGDFKNVDKSFLQKQVRSLLTLDKVSGGPGFLTQRQGLLGQLSGNRGLQQSMQRYMNFSKPRFASGIAEYTPPAFHGESVPLNLAGQGSGYEKYFRELGMGASNKGLTSAGLAEKLQAYRIKEGFSTLKNGAGGVAFMAGLDNTAKFAGSKLSNPFGNPFSVSAFRQAGAIGKSLRGVGVLGAVAGGIQAYGDYKDAAQGNGSYLGATANLANNAIAFAGPIGLAGSMLNRGVVNRVNKYESYQNDIVDEKGRSDYLAMYQRLLPRIQAQNKNKKANDFALNQKNLETNNQKTKEQMENDPNYSQGAARLSYHNLQNDLSYATNGKGVLDLSKVSRESLSSLNTIWKKENPNQKMDKNVGLRFLAQDISKDTNGFNSKYANDIWLDKQRTMPTAINAKTYAAQQGAGYNPSVLERAQTAQQNGQLTEMINILKELAQQGVNSTGEKALEQNVNFSALPININITSTDVPADLKVQVDKITQTLAESIADLNNRMTKIDGQTKPAKVQ